jgi:DNA-binding MarR family transcriptional regulator
MVSFTAFGTLALRSQIGAMSHKALRIYLLLSTYADRSGVCWPGIKELADMSCLHPESVMSALDELEQMGLMVYLRRNERDPVTKRQLVNVYEIRGSLLRADSEADSEAKHEIKTTNEITNDNNQFHKNHLHAPPPLTKPRREAERAGGSGVDYGTQPTEKPKAKDKNSKAKTAPQNSKALPPLPPLPRGFKADAPLDEDQEAAARWLCEQAVTRRDGGDYHAALSLANARRYIVRFGAWKCKAAVSLARRDPATRSLIGRTDYLLRTSVAAEAEQLEAETTRLTDLSDE